MRSRKYKSCGCLNKKNRFQKIPNTYDLSGDYGIGYTLNDEEFYFDLEDYEKISIYTWHIDQSGYVVTCSSRNDYYLMHRLIMDAQDIFDIDHINHKKNDNRKKNLRVVTTQQNCMNQKINKNNISGYSGVKQYKGKWVANIGYKNKLIYLGIFNNKQDAIIARKNAEEKYYKEFSYRHSMIISEENRI